MLLHQYDLEMSSALWWYNILTSSSGKRLKNGCDFAKHKMADATISEHNHQERIIRSMWHGINLLTLVMFSVIISKNSGLVTKMGCNNNINLLPEKSVHAHRTVDIFDRLMAVIELGWVTIREDHESEILCRL